MGDFNKWGDPSNEGKDFEMGGLIPLYGLWMGLSINSQSWGKECDALTKCSKDALNTNAVNTLYLLRVAKYKKKRVSKFTGFKTGEGLLMFKFKLGYVKEQLFLAVSVNSNKKGLSW